MSGEQRFSICTWCMAFIALAAGVTAADKDPLIAILVVVSVPLMFFILVVPRDWREFGETVETKPETKPGVETALVSTPTPKITPEPEPEPEPQPSLAPSTTSLTEWALERGLHLAVDYRPKEGDEGFRIVEPRGFKETSKGDQLLFVYNQDGDLRSYRMDRIKQAFLAPNNFTPSVI